MTRYNIAFQNIKAEKLEITKPETHKFAARRQTTLFAQSENRREGKNIAESVERVGVHLHLCFSRGSNEDLPLLQLPAFSPLPSRNIGVKNLSMPGEDAKSRRKSRG